MENRTDKAAEFHNRGYNCAQAVACSFCDEFGIDEETMFRLTEGMGLGMGCMEGTCGAVNGAVTILGLLNSSARLDKPDSKGQTYKLSKELVETFKNKNHSIVCKELKGVGTGEPLRSCPGCIEDAVVILEKIIEDYRKKSDN